MERQQSFYALQIEAIQNFYTNLMSRSKQPLSITDAILRWFTEGYAEKFREEYLKKLSTQS